MTFKFVDLFSGIGGFHAALTALGGQCVLASDIDEAARITYSENWHLNPVGDINDFANDEFVDVPDHDILVGGFPCQPFSKSGMQRGMDEVRGTLFWNIAKIIEVKQPAIVLLENVRNLTGPRHAHEWHLIIKTLRELGYRVSSKPFIVSPHKLRPEFGGRPQVRERVLIAATRLPTNNAKIENFDPAVPDLEWATTGWAPKDWNLATHLPLQKRKEVTTKDVQLANHEIEWINAWDEFVKIIKSSNESIPGFPIWIDVWPINGRRLIPSDTPDWKRDFIVKNRVFFKKNELILRPWLAKWSNLENFPASRRKFEWQAQDSNSLWECVMHFRPSGIRAKKATYVPALVAITQTSIVGKEQRRLTVREAARLQGFPEWFSFNHQPAAASYKQLGNAVNVGVIYQVLRAQAKRDFDILQENPKLLKSILESPDNPYLVLEDLAKVRRIRRSENEPNAPARLRLVK